MLEILGTVKDLESMNISNEILKEKLKDYLSALDDNYGADRDIYEDDGGYALIIDDENDVYEADEYVYLEDENYEYVEPLGDDYVLVMKLCNNEFSILTIIRRDVCPDVLLRALREENF